MRRESLGRGARQIPVVLRGKPVAARPRAAIPKRWATILPRPLGTRKGETGLLLGRQQLGAVAFLAVDRPQAMQRTVCCNLVDDQTNFLAHHVSRRKGIV